MTKDDHERMEAECDLDTLLRAIEIRKDKSRLAAAMAIAKERRANLETAQEQARSKVTA